MHIISFSKLKEYFNVEINSKSALQDWYKKVRKADWASFADMKRTFNSVDHVGGDRYVFNIKGNQYRLVAIVRYRWKRIYIRWVGSHKDYDRIKNIDKI